MTNPTGVVPAAAAPTHPPAGRARILHPLSVTVVVAVVSLAALVALVQGVLATGGGIPLLAVVLGAAATTLVVLLGLLFRRLGGRSRWLVATVIALADLGVYLALFVTGTQRPSIVSLGPEIVIAAVAIATGAASAILLPGWWRAVGAVGVLCLGWLALTPVLVQWVVSAASAPAPTV